MDLERGGEFTGIAGCQQTTDDLKRKPAVIGDADHPANKRLQTNCGISKLANLEP